MERSDPYVQPGLDVSRETPATESEMMLDRDIQNLIENGTDVYPSEE